MKLFSDTLPFFKANLHCHTACSDGRLTPKECMEFYKAAGYDVLSITDHRRVTVPESIPGGLLVLPGIELDYMFPEQWVHILGIGVPEGLGEKWKRRGGVQQGIDLINNAGALAALAHPAWSMNSPQFISSLTGLCGVEIFNSVSTLPYNPDRADSSSLLDVAWSLGGHLLPVMANDDSHAYGAEAGMAATIVQAKSLTRDGILDALKKGRYYATLGPKIFQVEYTRNREIIVRCSPSKYVAFISNLPWTEGRIRQGHAMTEASYRIQYGERFVRVEVWDEQGRKAWSAPVDVTEIGV